MLKCTKCGESLPATSEYFYRDKNRSSGFVARCKVCVEEARRQRTRDNPEKYRETRRRRYAQTPEKHREHSHTYYERNQEKVLERQREYRRANAEKINEQKAQYRIKNREVLRARAKDAYNANPEKQRVYSNQYRKQNLEKVRERHRIRSKANRQNPQYRVNMSMSYAIRRAFKNGKNGCHWESFVSYTLGELMTHLESQFTKGMAWDNYGAWHIDHIRPVSSFHFESCEDPEFKQCWSLWNLQPLWAFDNLSKGDKCEAVPLPLI